MNYAKIYNDIIEHARANPPTGYAESHHIIPVCLGGPDEKTNLVDLTPEQHFVCHQLLVKMHPGHLGIAAAAVMMSGRKTYGRKHYGWVKRAMSKAQKVRMADPDVKRELSERMSKVHKGKPKSAQWRETNKRIRDTPEYKAAMSAANKGKKRTPEQIENYKRAQAARKLLPNPNTGTKRTPEQKAKMAEAQQRRRAAKKLAAS